MKHKCSVPIFVLLLFVLMALCDVFLYHAIDNADVEGFWLLLSIPLFFYKYCILALPALCYFVLSVVLKGRQRFISNSVFAAIFIIAQTFFVMYTAVDIGDSPFAYLTLVVIWALGFLIVHGTRAEKQEINNSETKNKLDDKEK